MKNIAVFGGSFDPPHLGHRALVYYAQQALKLDEVWVMPVGLPVHRELTVSVSPQQRLSWVKSLFRDMPEVKVLDWEVMEKVPTASIETMQRMVNQEHTLPYWLMGMDAWQGMATWEAYPKHQTLCHVVVVNRVDEQVYHHQDWQRVVSPSQACAGCVSYIDAAPPNISASQIRRAILTGKDVSTVLDAKQHDEICEAYGLNACKRGME